jgi:hypothetical protein
MISFNRLQHIIIQLIGASVILLNTLWFKSPLLGCLGLAFYLWFNSKKLADILYPHLHSGLKNLAGFLTILAYISANYTLAYHLYKINFWVWLWVFLSIPLIIEILSFKFNSPHYFLKNFSFGAWTFKRIKNLIWPLAFFLLDLFLFTILFKKASLGIIRSPWELLNYKFWALFTLSNILLIITILSKQAYKKLFLLSWHFLLIASLGVILYPLGYGYDSFIHAAALKIIATTGTITPRLFLYVGQYGLTLFLQAGSQISLVTLNKILLPGLFSLIWPASVYYGLRYGLRWSETISYLATFWSLILGFNFAIMTTPQSLAFLLVALVIFLIPKINQGKISLYFIWALAIMALTIHPLGGLPLFFFSLILSLHQLKIRPVLKITLSYLSIGLASIVLPMFFVIYQRLNNFSWPQIFSFRLWPIINLPEIHWEQSSNWPLDMIYDLGHNMPWLYIFIVLFGLLAILQDSKYIFFKKQLLLTSLLLTNYLLAKIFLSFNLQIGYQKNDYTNRILYLIGLSLLPIFITSFYYIFGPILKNRHNRWWLKTFLATVTIILFSVSVYFSYPVYDQYGNSKSFNVTTTDLKTIKTIAKDAQDQPYIVLANQMVGAAAIKEYGFAHYYNNNFYYSMPLGVANIYQNYLNMIETNASQEEARVAMQKAGVNRLYFVVNNYWHTAKQALAQASSTANKVIAVDQGVNTIFVYYK